MGAGELPTNSAPEGRSDRTLLGEVEDCKKRLRGDVEGDDFGLPFNVWLSMRKYWGSITSGLDTAARSSSSVDCAGHGW